jgi:hypothetical protein
VLDWVQSVAPSSWRALDAEQRQAKLRDLIEHPI